MPSTQLPTHSDRSIAVEVWLLCIVGFVGLMVLVGGITRLTGSGLSMVDWHPLMGILPPTSEAEWNRVFALYQESPQFAQVNSWMKLADFRSIFFWEYLHRVLGRMVGLVFFLPWMFFVIRGDLRGHRLVKTAIAFMLGGMQGLLGWYMVKSGLVDKPEVSHFRLAAHLSLAFFVGMYTLWLFCDFRRDRGAPDDGPEHRPIAKPILTSILGLMALQVVYGAFMAGMKAGRIYQTYPDMNGSYFPSQAFAMDGLMENLLDNPIFVHAFHRTLGIVVAIVLISFAVSSWRRASGGNTKILSGILVFLTLEQIALGALTVVLMVPTNFAAAHQLTAYVLLGVVVCLTHHHWRARHTSKGADAAPSN